MKVTSSTRVQTRLQSGVFIALVITISGLLAWLSTRYVYEADWTMNNRNTLSEVSRKLLEKMPGPVTITAYASQDEGLRSPIQQLITRYQRHKADLTLNFVDPWAVPDEVRDKGIKRDGELLIKYQDRKEHVQQLSETELTTALERLLRQDRLVLFLQGHKERSPVGNANYDLNELSKQLKSRGFNVQSLTLAHIAEIPYSAGSVFVIADPQTQLLPDEIALISDYLDKGGNLLWLIEPKSVAGLDPIAEKLGLTVQPGMIIDPSRSSYSDHPAVVKIVQYGQHATTKGLDGLMVLFPQAVSLKVTPPAGWEATSLLLTHPQAWSETDLVQGEVAFDEGKDIGGPLDLAFALHRPKPAGGDTKTNEEQRVIIVGESDFLSDAFLHYSGNLDLSLHFFNWLTQEDTLIDIPAKTAPDSSLQLSIVQQFIIGLLFLIILPLSLISTGIAVWLRRRKA